MAFDLSLSRGGYTASYLVLTFVRFDKRARECSAQWSLYKDRASAKNGERPLVDIAAKVRVKGADFDAFFTGSGANEKLVSRLYVAAKAISADPAAYPVSHVVSDFGAGVFAAAVDVIE